MIIIMSLEQTLFRVQILLTKNPPMDHLLRQSSFLPQLGAAEIRHKQQKLLVCPRILSDCSIIPSSFFAPRPNYSPCLCHSSPLMIPLARTVTYQNSILVSSSKLWNTLPDVIVKSTSFSSLLKCLPVNFFI